jgi:lipase chaperone LimK
MKKHQKGLLVAGVLLFMIVAAGYFLRPDGKDGQGRAGTDEKNGHDVSVAVSTPGTPEPAATDPAATGIMDNPEGPYESRFGALPKMIRGTRVAGELRVTRDGQLILNSDIKYRFDFFLAAVSEERIATSVARIRENIERSLPPAAAVEANRILDGYLQYKQDLKPACDEHILFCDELLSFAQSARQVEVLRSIVEKRKSLRRKYLGDDVSDEFYGMFEIQDEFELKRMELFYNSSLNEEEKQASLEKLEDQRWRVMDIRDRKKRENDVLQEIATSKSRK